MFTINIDNATADQLFRDILVSDHKNLKKEIKALSGMEKLELWKQEDLDSAIRYVDAIETMMEYYIVADQRLEILRESAED